MVIISLGRASKEDKDMIDVARKFMHNILTVIT